MVWWRRRRSGRARGGEGLTAAELDALVSGTYHKGYPITMDDFRAAAESGNRQGMVVYGIGLGNRGDIRGATKWLKRSIRLGDEMGAVALATMYLDMGRLDEAERLFTPVAANGHAGAREGLALVEAARRRR